MIQDRNLRFPRHPSFPGDLEIFELPDGLGYRIQGAEAPVLLRGGRVADVLKYVRRAMDGRTTVDALVEKRPPDISAELLLRTLLTLHGRALLVEGSAPTPPAVSPAIEGERQRLYWERKIGSTRSLRSGAEALDRLARCRVGVIGSGLFGAGVCEILARSGCGALAVVDWNDDGGLLQSVASLGPLLAESAHVEARAVGEALRAIEDVTIGCDLVVLAGRRVPSALVDGIDELMHARRTPWLRGIDDGVHFELGPMVVPFRTGCCRCMQAREDGVRDFPFEDGHHDLSLHDGEAAGTGPLRGEAAGPSALAAAHLAMDAIRFLTLTAPVAALESVTTLEPITGSAQVNHFLRVPGCARCGNERRHA